MSTLRGKPYGYHIVPINKGKKNPFEQNKKISGSLLDLALRTGFELFNMDLDDDLDLKHDAPWFVALELAKNILDHSRRSGVILFRQIQIQHNGQQKSGIEIIARDLGLTGFKESIEWSLQEGHSTRPLKKSGGLDGQGYSVIQSLLKQGDPWSLEVESNGQREFYGSLKTPVMHTPVSHGTLVRCLIFPPDHLDKDFSRGPTAPAAAMPAIELRPRHRSDGNRATEEKVVATLAGALNISSQAIRNILDEGLLAQLFVVISEGNPLNDREAIKTYTKSLPTWKVMKPALETLLNLSIRKEAGEKLTSQIHRLDTYLRLPADWQFDFGEAKMGVPGFLYAVFGERECSILDRTNRAWLFRADLEQGHFLHLEYVPNKDFTGTLKISSSEMGRTITVEGIPDPLLDFIDSGSDRSFNLEFTVRGFESVPRELRSGLRTKSGIRLVFTHPAIGLVPEPGPKPPDTPVDTPPKGPGRETDDTSFKDRRYRTGREWVEIRGIDEIMRNPLRQERRPQIGTPQMTPFQSMPNTVRYSPGVITLKAVTAPVSPIPTDKYPRDQKTLRERREAGQIGSAEFARAVGLNKENLRKIETGDLLLHPLEIQRLHKTIDVLQGQWLKERREAARITQQELAGTIGHNQDYISDLEEGMFSVDPMTIRLLHSTISQLQGPRLRTYREASRVNQPRLARATGLRQSYISWIETRPSGVNPQSIRTLYENIDALQGPILRERREASELTTPQLASMTGVSDSFIRQLERSIVSTNVERLDRLHKKIDEVQGAHLRSRREAACLEIAPLAQAVGISPNYLSELETGGAPIDPQLFIQLHLKLTELQGRFFKLRRTSARLDQEPIALLSGRSQRLISDLETGRRSPDASVVNDLQRIVDELQAVFLRERREAARISQELLGTTAGFSQSYISFIESGDRVPSPETMMILHAKIDALQGMILRKRRNAVDIGAAMLARVVNITKRALLKLETEKRTADTSLLGRLHIELSSLQIKRFLSPLPIYENTVPSTAQNPEQILLRKEERHQVDQQINRVLSLLPAIADHQIRQAILLTLEGNVPEEVAYSLNLDPSRVNQLIAEGARQLSELIAKNPVTIAFLVVALGLRWLGVSETVSATALLLPLPVRISTGSILKEHRPLAAAA